MLLTKKTVSISSFLAFLGVLPAAILFLFLFNIQTDFPSQTLIWILSVVGWIEYLFCLYLWKRKTGQLFCPYIILFSFAFVHHYGQCMMWAFGIHLPAEIGVNHMYGSIVAGVPSLLDIIHTQAFCLMGLYVFHYGALIIASICRQDEKRLSNQWLKEISVNKKYMHSLLIVSTIAFCICMPAALYEGLQTFKINQIFGYGVLYNGPMSQKSGVNLLSLLSLTYFASMVGMLLASNYKKIFMFLSYSSFAIYGVLNVAAGNRGRFLGYFLFLWWMHNTIYKRLNWKRLLGLGIILVLLIILLVAIRDIRQTGVNVEALTNAITSNKNPFIDAFFEMGSTMSIPLILIKNGWHIYPFGNTYLWDIGQMITSKWAPIFFPNFVGVSDWFSKVYLGISYGAGFSLLGEALINYGPYFSLIWLFGLGMLYAKISTIQLNKNSTVLSRFFQITTAQILMLSMRNPLALSLKCWFFSTCLICIFTYGFEKLIRR